jgi:hypothetical protein
MFNQSLKASALALSVATLFSVLPLSSVEAQYYHRRHHAGDALAGGVIGGVVGGLAVNALINANRPVYHPPVYADPVYIEDTGPHLRRRPVYWARPGLARAPEMEVVPSCYMSRQRVWLDRYSYTHRYTRVCD